MSRFAIIIGVDHYENPAWRLTAAVDDALAFREWALGPGGVPPENVHLLLSPTPGREPSVPYAPADSDHITELIHEFQRGRGAGGERLYFYYAGHGAAAPGARDEVSILPADVRAFPRDAKRIIGFSEILPPLQECGPASQFFFVDACRDLLLEDFSRGAAPVMGRWRGPPATETPRRRAQYLLYATSPGGRALETGQGIFGRLLLQGLKGHPGALVWSQRELRYELRFSQLAEFVRTEVETQVKRLGGAWRQFLQLPEQDVPPGASGPRDFVLEQFTSEQVGKLPLRVRVQPGEVRQTCGVSVLYYAPGGIEVPLQTVKPEPPAPLPFPVELQLAPGDYTVLAQTAEFGRARKPCALYRPQTVELTLGPDPGGWEPFSGDPLDPLETPGGKLPEALTVRSMDPHIRVVLIAPDRTERQGFGGVSLKNPPLGVYRARLELPEGGIYEQTLEVHWGVREEFILKAPPPLLGPKQRGDLQALGLGLNSLGYLFPEKEVGPIAQPRLASLLGFAAVKASTQARASGFHEPLRRLIALPPLSMSRDSAGLWVLLSASGSQPSPDTSVQEFLAQSRLVLHDALAGQIAVEGRFSPLREFGAAAQWAQSVTPGPWVLELSLPRLAPTRYALSALKDHVSILVVVADDSGDIEVQQYMARVPEPATIKRFYPGEGEDESSTEALHLRMEELRHLEMGQRYLASEGRAPHWHIHLVLNQERLDPVLGCIAGYSLAREDKEDFLHEFRRVRYGPYGWSSLIKNMLHDFDALPDVHILAGLCEPEHPQPHFQRALERGLPLFSDGLRILQRHTDGTGNPWFAEASRGLIPGSLWTSWIVR